MSQRLPRSSRIKHQQSAFTLVEMLVVITIISILLAGGAAVMRSGTQASSVRVAADTLQSMCDQARSAAIGSGTEARLLIADNSGDEDRYLGMALVVVAEADNSGNWVWKPVGEARDLPGGVLYLKGEGNVLGSAGALADWSPIKSSAATSTAQFGRALADNGYDQASAWISIAFDDKGRVINPGLSDNPVLAVNLANLNGSSLVVAEPYERYAEGFVIIRSTGRPVRLEDAFDQAGL